MIKEKRDDRVVANRFNILIPVAIAITDVEKVRWDLLKIASLLILKDFDLLKKIDNIFWYNTKWN